MATKRERKPQRSALRTAGILAGGAGLAYGGIKIGRAAESIRRAAKAGEGAAHAAAQAAKHTAAAADNARVVTGAVVRAGRAVKKVGAVVTWPFRKAGNLLRLRFTAAAGLRHSRAPIVFAAGGVAVARYRKQLHDQDVERASGHFTKAAIAGGALGLALRKPGMTRKAAAGVGAVGFVGFTSVEVSKDVAAIKASQVSRSEIDTKMRDMDVKLEALRADYASLKVQLAALEAEARKR